MTRFGQGWTDRIPGSDTYINSAVVELLRDLPGSRVLDAGCGNGALARRLVDAGFDVVGVDWDQKAIGIAKERVPEAVFSVGSFSDEPHEQFDVVASTEVIEHLYDPDELLKFANQALRHGGLLVLSTPYHGFLKNLAISLVDGWDKHFTATMLAGHIKFFSPRTLGRVLHTAGFTVERFRGVGRVPYLWKSMIVVARKTGANLNEH